MGRRPKEKINDILFLYPCEVELAFHKDIRSRDDLSWGEKVFLAEIISIDRVTKGKCYYRPKELARRFFVSYVTIHKWTRKLSEMGFIDVLTNLSEKENPRIIKPSLMRLSA